MVAGLWDGANTLSVYSLPGGKHIWQSWFRSTGVQSHDGLRFVANEYFIVFEYFNYRLLEVTVGGE